MCCCILVVLICCFFFFKQKTAYEMRISDWSSDVCSSDLSCWRISATFGCGNIWKLPRMRNIAFMSAPCPCLRTFTSGGLPICVPTIARNISGRLRSEEHTSELQSLMRISYAVFCLKKKTNCQITQLTEQNHLAYQNITK